ncbi:PorP/SprF family type IX secretion system membrane protein [Flavobacterium aciduliphilum]|uniref:Type IX secretion system PorP/SprF family membrane protein n=1 Tax=Flavobacterium aciduliphilum TaxID=1101402 RepID=A0A328YPH8_9FLAO|nr:type IX secretion system membrane protein PorP/SprF [Flavobacterium aciduliphilum]RAR72437.1 type IX secretion system PorP/SprF family membrane protein [Flavobacterium aciduliphilum]
MKLRLLFLILAVIFTKQTYSQEILPVYSDYLSDNYFLLHPSMAGAANCAKIRVTGRQQWFGQEDAPALQTLSFNGRVSDRDGMGLILLNDKNGYHSQKGFRVAYAHHILFSRDEIDLNQLSFGVNFGFAQSLLDETSFLANNPTYDPIINGTIVQKATYMNMDIGASYNYLDFYAHLTVKNALASARDLYTDKEPVNLKRLVYNMGYTFGDSENIMFEPSFMFQHVFQTKESTVDLNIKAYKELEFGKLWGGISYRRSLDGAEYVEGNSISSQKLQYFTPLLGINFKNYMFAYTYSHLMGNVKFDNGGFHQITLGINLFCKPEKYHCNCPAVN